MNKPFNKALKEVIENDAPLIVSSYVNGDASTAQLEAAVKTALEGGEDEQSRAIRAEIQRRAKDGEDGDAYEEA